MLASTISNLAAHPDNRTRLYRAELSGVVALDRQLEGPAPVDASASVGGTTPGVGSRAASPLCKPATAQGARCASPGSPQRCASPSTTVAGRAGSPAGTRGSSRATTARRSQLLGQSMDSALAAAASLRPKACFPAVDTSAAEEKPEDAFSMRSDVFVSGGRQRAVLCACLACRPRCSSAAFAVAPDVAGPSPMQSRGSLNGTSRAGSPGPTSPGRSLLSPGATSAHRSLAGESPRVGCHGLMLAREASWVWGQCMVRAAVGCTHAAATQRKLCRHGLD